MSIMAYPPKMATPAPALPFLPRDAWDALSTAKLIQLHLVARSMLATGVTPLPRIEVEAGFAPLMPIHVLAVTWIRLRRRFGGPMDAFALIHSIDDDEVTR